MKAKYISRFAAVAMLALAASSCSDFTTDAPAFEVPEATMKPNATILEVKTKFWDDAKNYIATIPVNEDGSHIIVKGRVISDDRAGNVYKALWIQDATAGLPLSINRNSLYQQYRQGQEVVIDLTDMYIGKYNGLQQLGFPEWYAQGNAWEATFMPYEFFVEHSQLNGLPNMSDVDIVEVPDFGVLNSTHSKAYWQGRLVRLQNVHFDGGGELAFTDGYKINTNRTLRDANNAEITVRTSGYANFRNSILPAGNFDLVCLLGYYGTDWQVVINSLDDFEGVTFPAGTDANPYSVDDVVAMENASGYDGNTIAWTQGYIVGCVAPEVQTITSDADILWDGSDLLGNTLVIAPTADTRDISKVLVFALPSGSLLQSLGNLKDHPENLGREMKLYGKFSKVLDVAGVTNISGDADSFWIEGVDMPDVPTGDPGTADRPFTVQEVLGGASGTEVWVTGYIVGWIDGKSIDDGATFSAPATANTNILLAPNAGVTAVNSCIPIQLQGTLRDALGLMAHPENLGKQVSIKGNLEAYFGKAGLKTTTAYAWGSKGDDTGTGGDTPTPAPTGTLTFVKATSIVAGKQYIFVNDGKVAIPIQESYTYGYLYVEDPVSTADGKITTSAANAITIAASGSGYTLKDCYNRYLSMDDSHSSFQLYTDVQAGSVWTATVASNGNATFSNTARAGFVIRWASSYSNFAPATDGSGVLPVLYVLDDGSTPTPDDPTPDDPTPDDPTPSEKEGDGSQANPYTVGDVIAFDPQSTTEVAGDDQAQVWVTGYIVGFYNNFAYSFTADGAVKTNILLSATTTGEQGKCIDVQLPSGSVRNALNLAENPALLGTKVSVRGDILKYNTMPGVRNVKEYSID